MSAVVKSRHQIRLFQVTDEFWLYFLLYFISMGCFLHFELYKRKETWKKMLLECLFVSIILYKCQHLFYFTLIWYLTFCNSCVYLHDIFGGISLWIAVLCLSISVFFVPLVCSSICGDVELVGEWDCHRWGADQYEYVGTWDVLQAVFGRITVHCVFEMLFLQ